MNQEILKLQELIESEPLREFDVVVWLQGDRFDRGKKVVELFLNGYSGSIVLTGNNILTGKGARLGEENVSLTEMKSWLEKKGIENDCVVIDDKSMNTSDQALNVISLALKNNWRSIALVGSPYHQMRAFLTFIKKANQLGWTGDIYNQPAAIDKFDIPGGRNKTSDEIFYEELDKMDRYKADVATIGEGLNYISKRDDVILIRPAIITDASLLFNLRNDPITRSNSFNKNIIDWGEHLVWLQNSLENINRKIFIATNKSSDPIGQLRFDIYGNSAEISLAISQEFRGKGYGQKILQKGVVDFSNANKIYKFKAKIKSSNIASVKIFLRAGFVEVSEKDGIKELEYLIAV